MFKKVLIVPQFYGNPFVRVKVFENMEIYAILRKTHLTEATDQMEIQIAIPSSADVKSDSLGQNLRDAELVWE